MSASSLRVSTVRRLFDHILVVMFENQYRSYCLENPYLRLLAAQGVLVANSHGVMHPSQTNYIGSFSMRRPRASSGFRITAQTGTGASRRSSRTRC